MKSKISFFNKTIFLKNVTLYWPIWGIYTFILMCAMPISLWLNYNAGYRTEPLSAEQKFSRLCDVVDNTSFYIFLVAFVAVLIGMAVFNYLYNSKSANMIHALPVDRKELFGTNMITGFVFLAAPQVLSFVITILICLSEGVVQVEYLAIWLLIMFATDFIAFSIVTFCAFFTGQIIALPIYVVVVNCLVYVVQFMLELVVYNFGYGVEYGNLIINQTLIIWLSPLICYLDKVQFFEVYEGNKLVGLGVEGIHCILIYLLLAVVLYALAYLVYQKRQIEHAGDLITVGFVKPIFRCGVGIIGALYSSITIRGIFLGVGLNFNLLAFIILLLIMGAICYFVADMFVCKSFHVFKRENWKRCGLFSVILLVVFGGMYTYAEYSQYKAPKEGELECAFIEMGYETKYMGEEIANVIEIHEAILENVSYYEKLEVSDYYWRQNVDFEYINIYYVLKSGEVFARSYIIPAVDEGKEIIDAIMAKEQETENFIRNMFCYDYEDVYGFSDGTVEYGVYLGEDGKWKDESASLLSTEIEILYKAIIQDALEGNLLKYNTYYTSDEYYDDSMTYMISFRFSSPKGEENWSYWDYYNKYQNDISYSGYTEWEDYNNFNYAAISYGQDCKNIINALKECNLIDDEESLYWGDAYVE